MNKNLKIHSDLSRLAKLDSNILIQLEGKNETYFVSHLGQILKSDTHHAHKRKMERGITEFMVEIAICYGRMEEVQRKGKNDLLKFKLFKKDLKNTLFAKYGKILDGLVAITLKSNKKILVTTYFHNYIANNNRTVNEERYYRKKSNKSYKEINNKLKAEVFDYE